MKLFDEMEKCFPETEKHWDEMMEALEDLYLTSDLVQAAQTILCDWIIEQYLHPDGELYALFVQAGVERDRQMAALIVEWMHRARCFEGRPYINRTNSSLALQLGYQPVLVKL